MSDNRKWHLRGFKNPNFYGGAYPQTPLDLHDTCPVTLHYSPATTILNENLEVQTICPEMQAITKMANLTIFRQRLNFS